MLSLQTHQSYKMEATQSPEKARAPARSRKSIAHMPSPEVNIDKENVTIDSVAQLRSVTQEKPTSRKPRSKSIGPGGLDTLKEDAGNRRQVCHGRAHQT